MKHSTTTDGTTVWINSKDVCLGRFGVLGIDIHGGSIDDNGCRFCTHGFTTLQDWHLFQSKMREIHGITVSDRFTPKRFIT